MGDIIHTLPALTDAGAACAGIEFDWVVEEEFCEIPTWHPRVKRVIPIALRRWRSGWHSSTARNELKQALATMRKTRYDLILDAQGLIKSALLSLFAKGKRCGLDWQSARESMASLAYQERYTVNFYQHAIVRIRTLFSQVLGYPLPAGIPHYGLNREQFMALSQPASVPYVVFLHATTWGTKQWPETYWAELAQLVTAAGFCIKISGGNDTELARAMRIGKGNQGVMVLPRLEIGDMAKVLANAKAVVAVDTGFAHLAAALNVKTVSLYGPTNPAFTGTMGCAQVHLSVAAKDFPCSPCYNRRCTYPKQLAVTPACFSSLAPELVWSILKGLV